MRHLSTSKMRTVSGKYAIEKQEKRCLKVAVIGCDMQFKILPKIPELVAGLPKNVKPFHEFIDNSCEQNPSTTLTEYSQRKILKSGRIESTRNHVYRTSVRFAKSPDEWIHHQNGFRIGKYCTQFGIKSDRPKARQLTLDRMQ